MDLLADYFSHRVQQPGPGTPMLLVRLATLTTETTFQTTTIPVEELRQRRLALHAQRADTPESDRIGVVPIVKSDRNPWANRISIGRAMNNDIILRDPTVSKVHAHLSPAGSTFLLHDAGSRNGIYVGKRFLEPGQEVVLTGGELLVLGSVSVRYASAASFAALVASQGRGEQWIAEMA